MELSNEQKKMLRNGAMIAAVIVGIAILYWGYKRIRAILIRPPKGEYQGDGNSLSLNDARAIANQLHDMLRCWVPFGCTFEDRCAAISRFYNLPTNDEFIYVYNVYNQEISEKGLRHDLNGLYGDACTPDVVNLTLEKMTDLSLV